MNRSRAISNVILAVVLLGCGATLISPDPEDQPDPEVSPSLTNFLRFDGLDHRVTMPYDASFQTDVFTIAAEIKLTTEARTTW